MNGLSTPILYDLRGHVQIANLGLCSRKNIEESMLDIATIITSHMVYQEEPWANGAAHVAYHLGQELVNTWHRNGPAQSASVFEYADILSGYSIKAFVPPELANVRGNVEGNWSFFRQDSSMDSDAYTKIYYDFRYIFSTAVHEDRHIYEQHLYEGHDFYIGQKVKTSIRSILTSANNSRAFNADDAWIVLESDK
ncbi:uncharacterized protein LOC107038059 [Diachasma alloeum]|uniref:uncharacterized protein LOC107038059 n=1 Tax=Diachasma alloeum TaxID=454923 RepID=UPI00073847BB|nr:uncharacterized protein LOC107038059 [Diachasma alloeum]